MTQRPIAIAAADIAATPRIPTLAIPTLAIPALITPHLILDAFTAADAPALAAILANPEVARGITANTSTPARARKVAAHRIGWHNKSWDSHGYGIWALRERLGAKAGALIGWCGFTPPDLGPDPELLYGLEPGYWGRGLGYEAASTAIDWLFAQGLPPTPQQQQKVLRPRYQGIALVIFGRLNPASLALAGRLGFERKGRMSMADFMPDRVFAKEVVEYEIWRLGKSRSHDPVALLFQAAFKAGQITSLLPSQAPRIELALCDAACQRRDLPDMDTSERLMRTRIAFQAGMAEPHLEWLHRAR